MNIQQVLRQTAQTLADCSDTPLLDAQCLLAHVLDCNITYLFTHDDQQLGTDQTAAFQQLTARRLQGVPIAYLVGQREFWSLDFRVNEHTLIPRPETETLVDFILSTFDAEQPLRLLDMGTGTGAIAIAIASERPNWKVSASDVSRHALDTAKQNAEHNRVSIEFFLSNWFENISATGFDIIVSNPPYIASNDPHLDQGDVRFEPVSALVSGGDGLDDIRQLCQHAAEYLDEQGWLIVEHGYDQKQAVRHCFLDNHFQTITQLDDLAGQPRMTAGQKTQPST